MMASRFHTPRKALAETWAVLTSDQISLVSAGCAFYALFALFPALSLTISFYGLWFDLDTVEPQLALLERVMPADVTQLIATRVRQLVTAPRGQLGFSAAISLGIALWSSSAGVRALLGALPLARADTEQRGFFAFYLTALLLTLGAILAITVGLGVLVALPVVFGLLGVPEEEAWFVRLVSQGFLFVSVLLSISTLYRFGPPKRPPNWHLFSPGAVLATLLWTGASILFSFYLGRFVSYEPVYGALGAVVVLLTWFYLGVYFILIGAALNAARFRARNLGKGDIEQEKAPPAEEKGALQRVEVG
jgi:membrane protein